MIKSKHGLLLLLLWTGVACMAATVAFIAIRGQQFSVWLLIFKPMVVYYLLWSVPAWLVYQVEWKLHGSWQKNSLKLVIHFVLVISIGVVFNFLVHPYQWQDWLYGDRAPGYWVLTLLIYALVVLGSVIIRNQHLLKQHEQALRDSRLQHSLLENQLSLAQMNALKMQINPHFLFNALNSIAALIETDRQIEAYHTTELLGGLLQESLQATEHDKLKLSDELSIVHRYLEMERLRFANRFEFESTCDETLGNCLVPAFILQPVIENVFKHVISQSHQKIKLNLSIGSTKEQILVVLSNEKPTSQTTHAQSNGMGLKNIRGRLNMLYGEAATLQTEDLSDQFTVIIKLPLEYANE